MTSLVDQYVWKWLKPPTRGRCLVVYGWLSEVLCVMVLDRLYWWMFLFPPPLEGFGVVFLDDLELDFWMVP